MDLLSMISGDPMADPFLGVGLGLLGSAYNPRAPFGGALTGLQASSQARNRGVGQAAMAEEIRMRRAKLDRETAQYQRRQDILQMINDPGLRTLAELAPEQFVTGLMKNWGAAAPSTITPGNLTREELFKQYPPAGFTDPSYEQVLTAGTAATGYDPSALVPKAPTYGFGEEQSLRKEAGQRIEPIRLGVNKGAQLLKMLDRKGPVSDVAALYSLVSALDPQSVVREGEIGLVNSATGLWNQLQSIAQKAQGEGFLTPAMKQDMRGMTAALMELYREQDTNFRNYYSGVAGQYQGIDPTRVTGAPIRFPAAAAAPSAVPNQAAANDPAVQAVLDALPPEVRSQVVDIKVSP